MPDAEWLEVGRVADLGHQPLRPLAHRQIKTALVYWNGEFSAISGLRHHVGGPPSALRSRKPVTRWHDLRYDEPAPSASWASRRA